MLAYVTQKRSFGAEYGRPAIGRQADELHDEIIDYCVDPRIAPAQFLCSAVRELLADARWTLGLYTPSLTLAI